MQEVKSRRRQGSVCAIACGPNTFCVLWDYAQQSSTLQHTTRMSWPATSLALFDVVRVDLMVELDERGELDTCERGTRQDEHLGGQPMRSLRQ